MSKNKIFRFIFITDTHHTAKSPKNRKDNLLETSLIKLREVQEIAKEENVRTIVLHGGDVFDSPDISDNVAGIVGDVYKDFKEIYAISGNHDTRGNNLSTLPQTKLGLFDKLGIIKIIKPYEVLKFIDEKSNVSVQVTGQSSDFGINDDLRNFGIEEKECDIAIHIIHAMLVSQDLKFGSYVPLQEIQSKTVANITLSGDYHLGFLPHVFEEKVFLNPGAIVRKSNSLEEMARKPKVAIINIYDDKTFDYEYRELKSAKISEEVLDRSVIEEKNEYSGRLNEFKEGLNINVREKTFNSNIDDIILNLAKENNIEDEVLKIIIEKVSAAKTLLKIE